MPNFYRENDDLQFVIRNIDWGEFVPMLENDFKDAGDDEMAPGSLEEAVETYEMILETVGEVTAESIAPDAAEVDQVGATLKDGEVSYAPQTEKHIQQLSELGLMGVTIPRKYGGQNLPETLYTAINEMVARADSGLMTIYSLQGCAETINFFASEELKQKFLPPTCSGEKLHAMALTEPNAGSDTGAVKTKATPVDEEKGLWKINGSKQFITNGCADIILTLARSEEGTTDARGLSLFIVEKGPEVEIARIEEKMGIHGSPTCVLNFNDAPGYLVGKRRRGLTQYVFQLMFGARLGIAIQAIGVCQAAVDCARRYAAERKQFKTEIQNFPQVRRMLVADQVDLEAARALVYESAVLVDKKIALERAMENDPEKKIEYKQKHRALEKLCDTITPLAKHVSCELVNRVTSNAIQVHGGYGFTREYPAERLYRDARICNIYEGTTEIQERATVPGVLSGNIDAYLDELFEKTPGEGDLAELKETLKSFRDKLGEIVEFAKEDDTDKAFVELVRKEITCIAGDLVQGCLLLIQAAKSDRKKKVAAKFIHDADLRVLRNFERIMKTDRTELDEFELVNEGRN